MRGMTMRGMLRWCVSGAALAMVLVGCGSEGGAGGSAPDAATSSWSWGEREQIPADGESEVALVVQVRDAEGRALADQPVTIRVTGAGNLLAPATGRSAEDGSFRATLCSTRAEVKTVTVRVGTDELTLPGAPQLEFVATRPVASSVVRVDASHVLNDGIATARVTVALRDARGNPVVGARVQLRASGADHVIEQPPPTDAFGVTNGTLASTAEEVKEITATVDPGDEAVVLVMTPVVTFQPAPVVQGVARFLDVGGDGTCSAGDQVIVRFNQDVRVGHQEVAGFVLPVAGDTLGEGASMQAGPAADEVTLVLGSSPRLKSRQDFDPSRTGANSASGLDYAGTGIIATVSGIAVRSSVAVDLVPGLVAAEVQGSAYSSRSVALGDLDHDGDVDVVVGAAGPAPNLVLLNTGGELAVGHALGMSDTRAIALADLDEDGDLDLLVALADQALEVWWNDGSGAFSDSGQVLGAGVDARDLAVGDVDRDGDVDVVVAVHGGANLVFLNANGSGTLVDSGQRLGSGATHCVVLVDLDGDLHLDLVEGTGAEEVNRIWRNDGGGVFADSGLALGDFEASALVAGDLDGDGDQDLVLGTPSGADQVFVNAGAGVLSSLGGGFGDSATAALSLVDYDADGDLDLLTVLADDGVRLRANDGSGRFPVITVALSGGAGAAGAWGDLDRDGDLDLYVARADEPDQVAWNGLSGTWGSIDFVAGPSFSQVGYEGLDVADLDRDGDLDLVVASSVADATSVFWNDGAGGFSKVQSLAASWSARLGDLNGDGYPDLFEYGVDSGRVAVRWNDGEGRFGPQLDLGFGGWPVDIGDVDGDGDHDIVYGQFFSSLRVLFNDGAGNFTEGALLAADEVTSITLADIDRDGDLDLAVAAAFDNPSLLFWNDGQGSFSDSGLTLESVYANRIAVGDLDGDGDLDLLKGDEGTSDVFLNPGDAQFASTGSTLASGRATFDAALADLDGDGDLDALECVSISGPRYYLNDGTGRFTAGPVVQSMRFVRVADFDRDGDLDLTNGVRIYENR